MPELVASNGARFPLPPDGGTIGRHVEDGTMADPDVVLGGLDGSRTVSRRHIQIYRSGDDWRLKVESGARNATAVAGRPLDPSDETLLYDGDEITLGMVTVVFSDDNRNPPAFDPSATLLRTGPAAADISSGNVRIALAVAEGQQLSLGRRADDGMYKPDIDLRDASGGRTISRRHGLLFHRGDRWYLRVEAEVTNPTYLNGTLLDKGQEVALTDGDQLQMGTAVATFNQETTPEYVDSDRMDLVLGPPTDITLEAGANQTLPLKLVNFTGRVHWFVLEIRGLPGEWFKIVVPERRSATDDRPQVRLDTAIRPVPTATATANISVTFMPPRRSDATAGTYPMLVIATSESNQRLRRTAPGQLVVLPFASLRTSLEPAPPLHGTRGSARIVVYNDGNAPSTVALSVDADPKIQATLAHPELALANGKNAPVDIDLRVKHRPWLGPDVVHTATVNAVADGQTQSQKVALTCPPRIPLWLQRLFGKIQKELKPVVVVLAVLAATAIAGYFWLLPPDVKLAPDAPLVAQGASTSLSWNVQRGRGDAVMEGTAVATQVPIPNGKATITPEQTVDYKLTAKNLIGLNGTGTTTVQVLRVVSFAATPEILTQAGDPVTLQWQTDNATSVSIDPSDEITAPPSSGKVIVHPTASTVYHLTATNDRYQLSVTADARVTYGAPKITVFQQAQPGSVYPGNPVTLMWTAQGFKTLTLKGDSDDLDLKGVDQDVTHQNSIEVRPIHDGSQYTLIASNPDGTIEQQPLKITVMPIPKPQLVQAAVPDPTAVYSGDSVTLTWGQITGSNTLTHVTLKPADGDGIDVSGKMSFTLQPAQTDTYTLQVAGADGQTVASDPVTVQVRPKIKDFSVAPATITEGDPVVLTWTTVDAESVTVTRDDGLVFQGLAADQKRDPAPPATVKSYSITAHNATGDSQPKVIPITVQPQPTLPPFPQFPPAASG